MSATKEVTSPSIKKLGVIAGSGALPHKLINACQALCIEVFIIGFHGQTSDLLFQGHDHILVKLGQAGKVLDALRARQIQDLVLIGSIKRPSFIDLKPDLKAAKFFARFGYKALGDSGLLSALRVFLEEEGMRVHGVHKFCPDLLVKEGNYSTVVPTDDQFDDIKIGVNAALDLGAKDIGQACIVRDGEVVEREDASGTDAMLKRYMKHHGSSGVLVKLCKPQQDEDLDLPTIGPKTIENAAKAGVSGIVMHAGKSLMVDEEHVVQLANDHKIFVIGVDPKEYTKV